MQEQDAHPLADSGADMESDMLLCAGTGKAYAQFAPSAQTILPNTGRINFPACNGQPQFILEHHPFPSTSQTLWVVATGNIVYEVQFLGCASEGQCTYASS